MNIKTLLRNGLLSILILSVPSLLFAAGSGTVGDVENGIKGFAGIITTFNNNVIKSAGTLLMSLAVLIFFWGVIQYIWGVREGDAGKAKVGNAFMGWGLVALFVMFSVYGIIKFSQRILGIEGTTKTIDIPTINFEGSGTSNTSNTGASSPGAASPGAATSGVGINQVCVGTGQGNCQTGLSCIEQEYTYVRTCQTSSTSAPAAGQ
jgi:hypothetical protein